VPSVSRWRCRLCWWRPNLAHWSSPRGRHSRAPAAQSTGLLDMGAHRDSGEPISAFAERPASLPLGAVCRQASKIGAVCVSTHARICAGGAGQPASLPRPLIRRRPPGTHLHVAHPCHRPQLRRAAHSPLLMHRRVERLGAGHTAQSEGKRHQIVVRHLRHYDVELIQPDRPGRQAGVRH